VAELAALGGLHALADALRVDLRLGIRTDDAKDLAARAARFGSNEVPSRPRRHGRTSRSPRPSPYLAAHTTFRL